MRRIVLVCLVRLQFAVWLAMLLGAFLAGAGCAPARAAVPDRHAGEAMASWYGVPFHGRRTASGRRFDRWEATAAHKTLPFGTRLRVTDPRTGRSEVVTITDRGPFIRGRDLDLSEGTAARLGFRERGLARLRVERLR